MMTSIKAMAILAFAAIATAQDGKLDKPALTDNLDYLNQGNTDNHPSTSSTTAPYESGMVPSDCRDLFNNEGQPLTDMEVTYVTYSDCGDPWVFCRSVNSPIPLDQLIDMFGKVPVGMRDYVKHVLAVPGGQGAYNSGGNILFFDTAAQTFDVFLHESAHSLDLQGALTGGDTSNPYSSSTNWRNNYDMDPNVADNYAQSNHVENFAQETVVAIFDKAVPGGFGGVQPAYNNLFHQYATVQGDAGDKILTGGTCNRALQPSGPVSTSSTASRIEGQSQAQTFNGTYSNLIKNPSSASTKGNCNLH